MSDTILFIDRLTDDGVQTVGKGRLVRGGRIVMSFDTLELAWKNNLRQKSCIPPGPGGVAEYRVKHRKSARFERHLDVEGEEPHRNLVLIHAGNTFKHTIGCILVGRGFGDVNGDGHPDVLRSRVTLDSILAQIPLVGARLVIRGVPTAEPAPEPPPAPPVVDTIIEPLRPVGPRALDAGDIPIEELIAEIPEAGAPAGKHFTVTDVVVPDAPATKPPGPVNQTKTALQSTTIWGALWNALLSALPLILTGLTGLLATIGLDIDVVGWATYFEDGTLALGEVLMMLRDTVMGVLSYLIIRGRMGAITTITGWFRR